MFSLAFLCCAAFGCSGVNLGATAANNPATKRAAAPEQSGAKHWRQGMTPATRGLAGSDVRQSPRSTSSESSEDEYDFYAADVGQSEKASPKARRSVRESARTRHIARRSMKKKPAKVAKKKVVKKKASKKPAKVAKKKASKKPAKVARNGKAKPAKASKRQKRGKRIASASFDELDAMPAKEVSYDGSGQAIDDEVPDLLK